MIHEILFALLGHTGSIVIELPASIEELHAQIRKIVFIVNPNLGFLSQAEVEQLNKIVRLGALFKQIQIFVNKYGGINSKLALQLAYRDGLNDSGEQDASDVGSQQEDD
jgi:gamma-tubulin complex component 4